MANSASLLLLVSNLTNLLAMRTLDLTFVGFAQVMAPVLGVVLVIEYVAARVLFRGDLSVSAAPDHPVPHQPAVPLLPVVTVVFMLVGSRPAHRSLPNLLTNLSVTLLLVPLLGPLGAPAILAALLGLNIGSGLTYTGSLANLLWRRTLIRQGERPSLMEFHRASLVVTPISLFGAVSVLAVVTH